jgi:hypothetical protein
MVRLDSWPLLGCAEYPVDNSNAVEDTQEGDAMEKLEEPYAFAEHRDHSEDFVEPWRGLRPDNSVVLAEKW